MSFLSPRWRLLLSDKRLRRAAAVTGKALAGSAAASAGLIFGLYRVKRGRQGQEVDVWGEATVTLAGGTLSVASQPGPRSREASLQQLLERLSKEQDFSIADFRAAARALRPVEPQLEQLHDRQAAAKQGSARVDRELAERLRSEEASMVAGWKEHGYLNEPQRSPAGKFGRRLTSDAQGVDIGSPVPSYVSRQEGVPAAQSAAWDSQRLASATGALESWGCTMLRGALGAEDVATLRGALNLGAGAHSRKAGDVGRWLQQVDANIALGRYTFGRLHCLLRGSPQFEPHAAAAHAALAPLVHEFFGKFAADSERPFLSEAQLIVADPLADPQVWHVDAVARPGLSFFIPLSTVTSDRGPQEVLPGTHHLHDRNAAPRERVRRCLQALVSSSGALSSAPALPRQEGDDADDDEDVCSPWFAGDALAMDSRLLHRALKNESLGAPIPMLVLRYDLVGSPPPGCSRGWLRFMSATGGILDNVFKVYSAV